jgi:hypothetical protein
MENYEKNNRSNLIEKILRALYICFELLPIPVWIWLMCIICKDIGEVVGFSILGFVIAKASPYITGIPAQILGGIIALLQKILALVVIGCKKLFDFSDKYVLKINVIIGTILLAAMMVLFGSILFRITLMLIQHNPAVNLPIMLLTYWFCLLPFNKAAFSAGAHEEEYGEGVYMLAQRGNLTLCFHIAYIIGMVFATNAQIFNIILIILMSLAVLALSVFMFIHPANADEEEFRFYKVINKSNGIVLADGYGNEMTVCIDQANGLCQSKAYKKGLLTIELVDLSYECPTKRGGVFDEKQQEKLFRAVLKEIHKINNEMSKLDNNA